MSETFGRADQHTELDPIDGYVAWRTERSGDQKGGGGLLMLYKASLTAHAWAPTVPSELQYIMNERQWLLIDGGLSEKVAYLHVYIACQSARNDSYIQWNQDLFSLITQESIRLRRQGFVVIAMGDFNARVGCIPGMEWNTPDHNKNTPLFMNFISEVNLFILNTLPIARGTFSRFMDSNNGSSSLLDYGLISSEFSNSVTSFVIDEDARHACGSDHAVLSCDVAFGSRPKVSWSYQEPIMYNITDNTDYTGYQAALDASSSSMTMSQFSRLPCDQMLSHLTDSVKKSAVQSIGIKTKKKRRGRKLPHALLADIRLKNNLVRRLHASPDMSDKERAGLVLQINDLRMSVRDRVSDFKLQKRNRLRSRLLRSDPTRKRFWRFLKSQTKSAGSITALKNRNDLMVFEQHQIEDAVLDHFSDIFKGQRVPVYDCPPPVDHVALCLAEIDQLLSCEAPAYQPTQFENDVCPPFTFTELEQTLLELPRGKASGYDQIPNELLTNSSFKFKQHLLIFMNKILETGAVPEALNIGKCMLVHKVIIF